MAGSTEQKAARVPRYTSDDGDFLQVFWDSRDYFVAWTEDGYDYGGVLGDCDGPSTVFDDPSADEMHIASEAVRSYVMSALKLPRPDKGFPIHFETMKHAKAALRAANVALHAAKAKRPMPEWATIAIANGFTPPKGWQP